MRSRPRLTIADQLERAVNTIAADHRGGGEVEKPRAIPSGHRRGTDKTLIGPHRSFRAREASND